MHCFVVYVLFCSPCVLHVSCCVISVMCYMFGYGCFMLCSVSTPVWYNNVIWLLQCVQSWEQHLVLLHTVWFDQARLCLDELLLLLLLMLSIVFHVDLQRWVWWWAHEGLVVQARLLELRVPHLPSDSFESNSMVHGFRIHRCVAHAAGIWF